MDVVASSITIGALAASIAQSIVKLKACWEAIQDASDDIHFLVKRVELLSLVLRDIQDDQTQNPVSSLLLDGSTVSTCLETCKAAADRLGQLADKMATSIESSRQLKRKFASVKVVLKKTKIERFEAELQSCISLLQLSHESYTRALLRLQPDIIHAKSMQALPSGTFQSPVALQNHQNDRLAPVSSSEATDTSVQGSGTQSYQSFWQLAGTFNVLGDLRIFRKSYQKKSTKESDSFQDLETHEEVRAWYRGPVWLVNRAWAFHAVKARNGWDCCFRQYNIIPSDSPVINYAISGDVTALQELFDKNQASPWDCDDDGWTPLHYAIIYSRFSACKLLLQLGADSNHRNKVGESPTEYAIEYYSPNGFDPYDEALDIARSLTEKAEVDPSYLGRYNGSEEVFTLWQQSLSPQYYETALEERIDTAIVISWDNISNGPALFRRALARNYHIPRLAVGIRNVRGQTLLHAVAWKIGDLAQHISRHPTESKAHEADLQGRSLYPDVRGLLALLIIDQGWRLILRELIYEGADLHSTNWKSHTPFMSLLEGSCRSKTNDGAFLQLEILNPWLSDLRDCGVDLYEYGRREEGMGRDGSASREFEIWDRYFIDSKILKLVSFTYGSSPSDWHLQFKRRPKKRNEQREQVQGIPGSWVED